MSQIYFIFETTLYMFRAVFPSIIRSLKLYIQHHTIQVLWLLASKQPQKLYDVYLILPAVVINPLNPELNPICYMLALLGDHHFLHVSRIRVKSLTLRRLVSYIYGAPILDVSRSHTTTQHSR